MNIKKVMPLLGVFALVLALTVTIYGSASASPSTGQVASSVTSLNAQVLAKDQVDVDKAAAGSKIDMFLKLDGIAGESQDEKHPNEIEVLSFGQGMSQTIVVNGGGGGGSGKAKFSDISFRHQVDSASVQLMVQSATGKHIKNATFSFKKPGQSHDYYVVTLTDVLISSVTQAGSQGKQGPLTFDNLEASSNMAGLLEEVTLNFHKIEWTYYPQNPDGSTADPIHGGWDVDANKKV